MRGAGAVIHSHGMESCIVTMMNPYAKEFKVNSLIEHYIKCACVFFRFASLYLFYFHKIIFTFCLNAISYCI
jgi:hypothetical protein